jgi:RND family efflux transporter MFP subunit
VHGNGIVFLAWLLLAGIGGCSDSGNVTTPAIPSVTVTKVLERTVPEYAEYVGTTQAVRSVDIVARVEGFLQSQNFVDGSYVKKGDLLFVIDPDPFSAALETAQGQLGQSEAQLAYTRGQMDRYRELADLKYISTNTYEDYVTQTLQAKAAVEVASGELRTAQLNLGYTRIYAPFAGRIGRRLYDVGNLVGPNEDAKLAVLVQLDPIYVYFGADAPELPRILKQQRSAPMSVTITTPDPGGQPYSGHVDFVDNSVDASTGTVTLRALIPNPDHLLLPGQYTRVRMNIGQVTNALLVPQTAVITDHAGQTIFVVNAHDKVAQKKVITSFTTGDMIVIKSGLNVGDRVVVNGQQKVHSGSQVKVTHINSKQESSAASGDQ